MLIGEIVLEREICENSVLSFQCFCKHKAALKKLNLLIKKKTEWKKSVLLIGWTFWPPCDGVSWLGVNLQKVGEGSASLAPEVSILPCSDSWGYALLPLVRGGQ